MDPRLVRTGWTTLGILLAFLSLAPCVRAEIRVGVAARDITPPLGVPLAGYYHARGADGVLDPLFSKALVLEQDGQKAALVVLDIISISRSITAEARTRIEKETGIPGSHVMISATHAHTGPQLVGRGSRTETAGPGQQLAAAYTERLPELIAEGVRQAAERLQPARLSVGSGRCEGVAFNRRYFMRDGSTGWNPGKLNPNIVMPAGPTDPEVGVLYIDSPGATPPLNAIATYVNFAMHPDTTGGSKISADWPGALGRVLAAYHGAEHLTLVANGTCGNLNHVDVNWKWPNGGPPEQNRIATLLGASIFQTYKDVQLVTPGPLRARSENVELLLPETSLAAVEEARQILRDTPDDRGTNFMRLVRAHRVLDVAAREGKPHRVEVQVVALGKELAWVGLPGEIFVELGLALKKKSPFAHTFIAELANESVGYVPDRRSYAEGAYEPESARCAAGSGERLITAAAGLLDGLYQDAEGKTGPR